MLELIGLVVVIVVISVIIDVVCADEADVSLTINGKDIIKYSKTEKDDEENNSKDL